MKDRFEAYRKRNKVLRAMGFESYKAYLASDLWASIRAFKLQRDPFCYACFNGANQVHHKKYTVDNLLGLTIGNLVSVCRRCHELAEFHRSGGKMSVNAASNKLRRMRKANRIQAREAQAGR